MKTVEKNGKTYALVPLDAWQKLATGQVMMPELPRSDADGNVDAIAYARASIARTIIRDRVAAGLSQAQLAERAGITRQVLNRIEHARVMPDASTVAKIDKAIQRSLRLKAGRIKASARSRR